MPCDSAATGRPRRPGQRGRPHRQAKRPSYRPLLRPRPAGGGTSSGWHCSSVRLSESYFVERIGVPCLKYAHFAPSGNPVEVILMLGKFNDPLRSMLNVDSKKESDCLKSVLQNHTLSKKIQLRNIAFFSKEEQMNST